MRWDGVTGFAGIRGMDLKETANRMWIKQQD